MRLFDWFRPNDTGVEVTERVEPRISAPNPHTNPKVRSAGFGSNDAGRLLTGWETSSSTIDYYLQSELRQLRARSRKLVRANPYGKRYINVLKSNIIGKDGVKVQAKALDLAGKKLDYLANTAIESAFADWAKYHCDHMGRMSFVDLQNMAISCAGQDGEFLFRKRYGGKYGYQLQAIDPELLDIQKSHRTPNGEIRLGVEYDDEGRVVRYHFRRPDAYRQMSGGYDSGDEYWVDASEIIHGFVNEWPDQSRGVPWLHASLERAKHLEKYDEAAIVNARAGASTMGIISGPAGEGYTGDEEGTGEYAGDTIDSFETGAVKDIGDRTWHTVDPDYPHQMYADFVKANLRAVASGLGISYHSISNDLEGVNYSSIRAGVLEDREIFKGLQEWFIRSFVQPVYDDWLVHAQTGGKILINGRFPLKGLVDAYRPADFQGRRWDWVDPAKDGAANQMGIDNLTKSRSQIIRESGRDPETVFREIQSEGELLDSLGLAPVQPPPMETPPNDTED